MHQYPIRTSRQRQRGEDLKKIHITCIKNGYGEDIMDKIIRITIGLIIVVLVAFIATVAYTGFVDQAFRTSLSSTYSYTFSLVTDSRLDNVTLFIPVPEDHNGNSPLVNRFSAQDIEGLPGDWQVTLFDTGKATVAKITAPRILPLPVTSTSHPYTVRLVINTGSDTMIATRAPVEEGVMFRPVQNLLTTECTGTRNETTGTPVCSRYTVPIYADYQTTMNASVSITSALQGKNRWTIFEPQSNEYQTDISVRLNGEHHGWTVMNGTLESNRGQYTIPAPSR
jgi:hypothetical protein